MCENNNNNNNKGVHILERANYKTNPPPLFSGALVDIFGCIQILLEEVSFRKWNP